MNSLARRFATAALALAATLPLSGCIINQNGYVGSGSLLIDWTIATSASPARCGATGSAYLEVIVDAPASWGGGTYRQDCSAFSTSVDLDPGTYTAHVRLVDESGVPRTSTVDLPGVVVRDGYGTPISIDFPPDSFR